MATKYLIAGGNYSSNLIWSTTSGGANDTTAPTSSDDVICDANSGAVTLTVNTNSAAKSIDFTGGGASDFTGTFQNPGGYNLELYGNIALSSLMLFPTGGQIVFKASSTITTNGKQFTAQIIPDNNVAINLNDNLNSNSTIRMELYPTGNSLNSNSHDIICTWFRSGNNSNISLGTSEITCTEFTMLSGITLDADETTINCSGNFSGGGKTYGVVNLTGTSAIIPITGANTFGDLTLTGHASATGGFSINANQIVTDTFTATGNSVTNRMAVKSSDTTQRTITAAVCSLSNVDFSYIKGAGAGTWSGTALNDLGGNSDITMPKYLIAEGNWNTDSIWAFTDGGLTSGATYPRSCTDVYCTLVSGAITLTVNVAASVKSSDFTGFTGTLGGSQSINAYGSVTFVSGMTFSWTGNLLFWADGVLAMGGKTLAGWLSLRGGSVQLGSDFNGLLIGLYAGTFTTNNYNITLSSTFNHGQATSARALNLGSSVITTPSWSSDVAGTNLTLDAGTSVINCSGNFNGVSKDYNEINITVGSGTTTISGNNTGSELNFIGSANKTGIVEFAGNQDFDTITSTPNSITNRLWFKSSVTGTARTLTADNVTIANTDFQDITCAGSGTWSGTSIGDCGGNTGLTGTTPVTRYWIGNAGSFSDTAKWAATSNGAGGETVPLVHDSIKVDANSVTSGSQTLTFDMPRIGGIDMSAVANTPILSLSNPVTYCFGELKFGNISFASTKKYFNLQCRNNFNISSVVTLPHYIFCAIETATATLLSNLIFNTGSDITNEYNLAHCSGILDFNDFNVTLQKFRQWKQTSFTNNPTLNMGNGIITATGRDDGAHYTWRNLSGTINYENSTLILSGTSASYNKSLQVSGQTFHNFKFTGSGNPAIIQGSNTFNEIEVDSSAGANTLTLTAGTTQTVGQVVAHGSTGKKITINSSTPGSPAYLVDSSGSNNLQYVDLTDIQVSGGADWTYDFNSTYNTGNSGWRANSNEFNFSDLEWNTESAFQ